jgi:hypothetical protein
VSTSAPIPGEREEPFTLTSKGDRSVSSLVILRVDSREPDPVGVKVTLKVSDPPAATELGRSLTTNSELFAPVLLMLLIVRAVFPVFFMVNVEVEELFMAVF